MYSDLLVYTIGIYYNHNRILITGTIIMKSRGLSDLSGTYKTLNHNFVGTYHYTRDSADEIKDLLSYAATHTIEFYHVRFNKPALKIILDAINSSKITQVCFYHCNFQGQDIKAKVESLVY